MPGVAAAPDDFAELRGRVDRLEVEMAEVRGRVENAETLAGLADRDISDIKTSHAAIMRSMEALRDTQIEQGRDISQLKGDVRELRRGLGVVRDGVATIITLLSNGHGS